MSNPSADRQPTRLLFVCVENSNRSQMAEAFARIHGRELVEAFSAGSRPSGKINPRAIEAMKAIGYDLTQHRSKSLTDIPDVEFDFVATMGCGDECPIVPGLEHDDWPLADPKDQPLDRVREIREEIRTRILALLESRGWLGNIPAVSRSRG